MPQLSRKVTQMHDVAVFVCAGLLHGLLLPAVLAGLEAQFPGPHQEPESQYQDAGANMAPRYVFLQRQELLRTYHHRAEQTAEDHTGGRHPVLHAVSAGTTAQFPVAAHAGPRAAVVEYP